MKIEIVTPAGRQRFLELLFLHLESQKADFDQWTLWLNTTNQSDIDFCKKLERENEWIKTVDLDVNCNGNGSISSFFKHAKDPDTIYIRLDDDVVWTEQHFIKKLSKFRLENPEYFLVYGNIINNAIIDHIHQRIGALEYKNLVITYNCGDSVGWGNSDFAEIKHKNFFQKLESNNLDAFKFDKWDLFFNERVSINCISWFGKDFEDIGTVDYDEEQFLSSDYPNSKSKLNTIYGQALCSHFAFHPQRKKMDNSSILNHYKLIAEQKKLNNN
jgi:hypothetical protein